MLCEGETAPQRVSTHILIWYNVKGWSSICTAIERIYGIFVVDIMYKKRYRYCIHTCYYTMTIFYPVWVDVIFIECFDPEWRGWSGSVLFYLQPCSRNNRPAVQMSTYLSVWCMVIYFCCMFIYLIKMGVGKYITDSSYFKTIKSLNVLIWRITVQNSLLSTSPQQSVYFGPSWCICQDSNWDSRQVVLLSFSMVMVSISPTPTNFSNLHFNLLLVTKVRVNKGAEVCWGQVFCLFLVCYICLFAIFILFRKNFCWIWLISKVF